MLGGAVQAANVLAGEVEGRRSTMIIKLRSIIINRLYVGIGILMGSVIIGNID